MLKSDKLRFMKTFNFVVYSRKATVRKYKVDPKHTSSDATELKEYHHHLYLALVKLVIMLRIWISLFLRKHCLMCSAIGMFSDTKLDNFTSIITSWTEPEQTVYPEVHPLRKKNSVFTGWKISWTHRIVAVFNWVTITHSHYV